MMEVLSYGIGTLVAIAIVLAVLYIFISDITQKKHGVLRNYPVVGHLRYFFEELGEYFRQYFFSGDREEMPFNRATRGWVYRLAKNEGGMIGFGSTYDLREPGSIIFVNHPFPVLEEDRLHTPSLLIGEGYCRHPFEERALAAAKRLADDAAIMAMPGSAFGPGQEDMIRFAFGNIAPDRAGEVGKRLAGLSQ